MPKPQVEKVPTFYQRYVQDLPDENIVDLLNLTLQEFKDSTEGIDDAKANYAYEEGKWTIKEVLSHVIDAEQIFAYRALRFSRNDKTDLPGFEQDDYVTNSFANDRSFLHLKSDFETIRSCTVNLFKSFNERQLGLFGSASGYRMDVNTLGYIICGHLRHHLSVLKEKYLN